MPGEKQSHTEDLLDEALKDTFPASDAVAIVAPQRRKKQAPQDADDMADRRGRADSASKPGSR